MQMTLAHMEVLHHHFTHGKVWDGDQISKSARDDLRNAGYLIRVEGGFHRCTPTGGRLAAQIHTKAGNA